MLTKLTTVTLLILSTAGAAFAAGPEPVAFEAPVVTLPPSHPPSGLVVTSVARSAMLTLILISVI